MAWRTTTRHAATRHHGVARHGMVTGMVMVGNACVRARTSRPLRTLRARPQRGARSDHRQGRVAYHGEANGCEGRAWPSSGSSWWVWWVWRVWRGECGAWRAGRGGWAIDGGWWVTLLGGIVGWWVVGGGWWVVGGVRARPQTSGARAHQLAVQSASQHEQQREHAHHRRATIFDRPFLCRQLVSRRSVVEHLGVAMTVGGSEGEVSERW